jgi:hypothetical protein
MQAENDVVKTCRPFHSHGAAAFLRIASGPALSGHQKHHSQKLGHIWLRVETAKRTGRPRESLHPGNLAKSFHPSITSADFDFIRRLITIGNSVCNHMRLCRYFALYPFPDEGNPTGSYTDCHHLPCGNARVTVHPDKGLVAQCALNN